MPMEILFMWARPLKLKARVTSYFRKNLKDVKTQAMIAHVDHVEVTSN